MSCSLNHEFFLQEGDIILEINGMAVQNMPHNNVVQMLKDCPFNSAAIFVIQRGPILMGGDPPFGPQTNLPPENIADPYGYALNNHAYVNRMKVKYFVE